MLPTDSDLINRLTPFGKWLYARLISVGVIVVIISSVMLFLAFESEDIRKWLGALSGWIAAAGALGVGLPTLRFLKDQVKLPIAERQLVQNQEACDTLNDIYIWLRQKDQEDFCEIKCISHAYNYSAEINAQIVSMTSGLPHDARARINNNLSTYRVFERAVKQLRQQSEQTDFTPAETRKTVHDTLFKLSTLTGHLFEEISLESEKLTRWKRDLLLN